jgi:hypothetical protein
VRRKVGWLLVIVGAVLCLGDLAGAARLHPRFYEACHRPVPGARDRLPRDPAAPVISPPMLSYS